MELKNLATTATLILLIGYLGLLLLPIEPTIGSAVAWFGFLGSAALSTLGITLYITTPATN